MKKLKLYTVVEVEIPEKKSDSRTADISRVMQIASNFGAKLKYMQDDDESAKVGFESDNPEALYIMLNN